MRPASNTPNGRRRKLTKPDVDTIRLCIQKIVPNLPEDSSVDLFSSGIIDSLIVLNVMMSLEEEFSVSFEPGDLEAANLRSLDRMAETVGRIKARG